MRPAASLGVVLSHPWAFLCSVVRSFRANQGLLLAGAVAYYALLSIVPMLILAVMALSHVVDEAVLLTTITRVLGWLVPGHALAVVAELRAFLAHGSAVGWLLLVSMLFFSSLAFTVLENAMSIIFRHRVVVRRRHYLVSALIPYVYIMCLGVGLLVVTGMAGLMQGLGREAFTLFGRHWPLDHLSTFLLYLLGVAGEVVILASIYLVMPVGRLSLRNALLGAATAALLWELSRHALVWYFATLSQISLVYGSLTTAIAVLLSLELAGTFLLFGAQVIAEIERGAGPPNQPWTTPVVPGVKASASPQATTPPAV